MFKGKEADMRKKEPIIVTPVPQEEKILDVNATMQGSLRFDDPVNLRINGRFEGTLETKGKLMIGDRAEIKADITGESISIEGIVTGNIKASKVLRLGASARLYGDIETAALSIEEGAVMNGQLRMEKASPLNGFSASSSSSSRNSSMNLQQVAKYLEIDKDKVSEWAANGKLPGMLENGEWFFEKNRIDQWITQGSTRV